VSRHFQKKKKKKNHSCFSGVEFFFSAHGLRGRVCILITLN
jgi:hypothetical protein